jgi:predicted nucleic acid-binding protein
VKTDRGVYVLDSFALLAYVRGEAGAEWMKSLLTQAQRGDADLYLTIVNFGEAIYITERSRGLLAAQGLIAAVDQLPITVVEVDRRLTFSAAHLKAHYPISYADAFAVALAQQLGAVVLTGDPEFHPIEELVAVDWLPRE